MPLMSLRLKELERKGEFGRSRGAQGTFASDPLPRLEFQRKVPRLNPTTDLISFHIDGPTIILAKTSRILAHRVSSIARLHRHATHPVT